jgi:deoxyribodipyrimidine photo-lyase
VQQDIEEYSLTRDQPALMGTSQLSAYLTLGVISPRLCYLTADARLESKNFADNESELEIFENNSKGDVERWISELAWRDFYRHVLVDRPDIVKGAAYKKDTDNKLNWSYDNDDFEAWCQGMTGVPLIDAAMRCLNQTGFMHNRLRMVTAMFLTKDLFIDWRLGERYFMQNLIDGDFASNNGGWQWSASTGTDAAPYFRIMNPFSQAKTHDKDAIFIKSWLPELKDIPANILHDENKLRKALSKQGAFAHVNYPLPMVEHKQARRYAIEQFKARG